MLAPRDCRVSSKNETPPVCSRFHTLRSSRTNQLTAPRVPGVLLHCCTVAVCSKGLIGGWVEGALTASSVVGGWPAIILVYQFLHTEDDTAPMCFLLGAGVPLHCCTYCCTAVLLYLVCSKGLVGGRVEGALRRPCWVGGSFCRWESFFVQWEMNLFLYF